MIDLKVFRAPALFNASGAFTSGSPADAIPNAITGLDTRTFPELFNETTYDRQRNNTVLNILPTAVRNGNVFSATQVNYNASGMVLQTHVSVKPGGGETLIIAVLTVDSLNNLYSSYVLQNIADDANTLYQLIIYPGASGVPENVIVNKAYALPVPRLWRVVMVHSGGGNWTYDVDVSYIL